MAKTRLVATPRTGWYNTKRYRKGMRMRYEGSIYRPPSEAHSLLLQVTIGCAWNRCTFCTMYKDKQFRVRPMQEIRQDLDEGARLYKDRVRRVFLCDGDALVLDTAQLAEILQRIKELFPDIEGVRSYASARDILRKTPQQLEQLRALGLDMVYIGLETGSDELLRAVDKGERKQDMIDAAALLRAAGIRQSISIIAGLGGETGWERHTLETADALNRMQPEYLGMLTLTAGTDSPFSVPSSLQVLREMRLLVEHLSLTDCLFTSAHASNYVHIRGQLPQEKEKLLSVIDKLIVQTTTEG